jgi:anthranilate phosphoribosyltransferase
MPITADDARLLASKPAGMSASETTELLELLISATLDVEDGAQLLKTWAGRGETGVELAATVRYLRDKAVSVPVAAPCFDLCGTGGSGLTRYNVSTTVAFVAAAAGVPVAKHGNRGSRRPNGSFDLLEALNVPFELSPAQEASLQKETGVCFIFARTHHPAVGKVVPYRKAAACRNIFNMAGPLANPAAIKHQIIGTVDEGTARVVANALSELKTEGALVVWGEPGIDEISVTGRTGYLHVAGAQTTAGSFTTPAHPELDYAKLPGGDAPENAETFLKLLSGKETGPLLDMVCENAGAAIDLWNGESPSYGGAGAAEARQLIAEGVVMKRFEAHRAFAQKLAGS